MTELERANMLKEIKGHPTCNGEVEVFGTYRELRKLCDKIVSNFTLDYTSINKIVGYVKDGEATYCNVKRKLSYNDTKVYLAEIYIKSLPMPFPVLINRPDGEELEVNVKSYRLRLINEYGAEDRNYLRYSPSELLEALQEHYNDLMLDNATLQSNRLG